MIRLPVTTWNTREGAVKGNLILALFLTAAVPRASGAASLAITDVTVVDPGSASPQPHMTVVVSGTRITALGPAGQVTVPRGTRVVDGARKFLIPGLWDMHAHLTDATEAAFPLLVAHGIAGVRDLGGNLAQLDRWRAEIARGTRLGPLIARVGPFVDGPKDETTNRLAITAPEAARRAVDSLAALGVDGLKVHNKLPRDAFFALLARARQRSLRVAVHLPEGVSAAEASDSGAASLEHIETLITSAAYRPGATAKTWDAALDESRGESGARLFATFVRNGTYYDPTLTAYYHGFVHWEGNDTAKVRKRRLALSQLMAVAGDMHRAGVPLLAGSDFTEASVGVRPGADLHHELAMLVEVGLTPREALQCATLHPARFLGMQDSLGTIATGKRADLILLAANPLENIHNTRTIQAVVLGGRLIEVPAPRAAPAAAAARRR
jgi:imidazolonepropionase-like amidohydrolase